MRQNNKLYLFHRVCLCICLGLCLCFYLCFSLILSCNFLVNAADLEKKNSDTGYLAQIYDEAELLTDSQKSSLFEEMMPITDYGNVAFISTNDSGGRSSADYARSTLNNLYHGDSATLFLIDMDNRMVYIHSDGAINKRITSSYANSITDNVYRDVTRGNYYDAASEAFREIDILLEGGRIAEPMKYISNFLLALCLAILVNYFFITRLAARAKTRNSEILSMLDHYVKLNNPQAIHTGTTREYSPRHDSDSGGRSGGGGGGGGGGGSGGGHSF